MQLVSDEMVYLCEGQIARKPWARVIRRVSIRRPSEACQYRLCAHLKYNVITRATFPAERCREAGSIQLLCMRVESGESHLFSNRRYKLVSQMLVPAVATENPPAFPRGKSTENSLTRVPPLSSLGKLQELDLAHNNIDSLHLGCFPHELGQTLRRLNLAGNR